MPGPVPRSLGRRIVHRTRRSVGTGVRPGPEHFQHHRSGNLSPQRCDRKAGQEAWLANRIHDIWTDSRRRYGVPRVTAQLWREGVRVNRKRVARLMCLVGIQGICGRRKVVTTRRDPKATPAPDLVQRRFEATELDRLYVGDITSIPTDQGFCYLAGVQDVCSRRIVGRLPSTCAPS